ncbi:PREDICTED: myb-like protein M [Habropoda laboriosa]|uniref:myb-like protein M n=1 Tax=Habropoda laboriosa TaxID=597456 RepID=UPI00083D9C8E|nr:PREDICTED: myb-like protein M [Habropoda laboriosa]
MGHTKIQNSAIRGPHENFSKDKNGNASSGYQQQSQQQQQQQQQQQSTNKKDKYGSWGPVYKNKQNFIDMHIC